MATLREYYNAGDDSGRSIFQANWDGQTFTTDAAYTCTSVKIKLYKSNNPSGDVTVSLRATSAGVPTGDDLASATVACSEITTTPGAWHEFVWDSPVQLDGSTQYAIVIKALDADSDNRIFSRCDGSSPTYSGGTGIDSSTGGSSWTVESAYDTMFEVWSDALTDKTYSRQLIAIGGNKVWYESVAGTMSALNDADNDVNTFTPLEATEAYQKIFIANKTKLKVADFVNTKITTTDVGSHPPDFHTILTGETSGAKMVVDYITTLTGACTIYGKRTTDATFSSDETVTGVDGDGNAISFTTSAAEDAPPHWYDYNVYGGSAAFGSLPDQATLICRWRGRIVLSGDEDYPHQWYMSRQRNPWDYNYVANDAGAPIAGADGDAGEVGDIVIALIPFNKDYLVVGCANSIWFFVGDPAEGGSLLELDSVTGILHARAWCKDKHGNMYFVGTTGINRIPKGFDQLENLTELSYPDFIDDLAFNSNDHRLLMAYDPIRHGIHIIKTTIDTGANSCWWYDLRTEGLFPESYPTACGIFAAHYYESTDPSYRGLLFGCNDGYLRYADDGAKDDDIGASDAAIDSYVTFGPFALGGENQEGIVASIVGVTTGGGANGSIADSSALTYSAWTALSADNVVEKLAANTTPNAAGTIAAPGRNRGARKRKPIRGLYAGIRIGNNAATQTWGLERLIIESRVKGRVK